jgi:murein L,D-transpeptidase YafK
MRRVFAALCLLAMCGVLTTIRPAMAGEAQAAVNPAVGYIDKIVVDKTARQLQIMREGAVVRSWPIGLGFEPEGHKTQEGDGKTPEGWYVIDYRNPESEYYLSLRISYPNDADRAQAAARGVSPGGQIYIHGQPSGIKGSLRAKRMKDWTAGCIAVSDEAMDELWRLVDLGTPIEIHP